MKKEFEKALYNFIHHFKYTPNHPNDIDFDQIAFANLLNKCVKEDKDYTIELYGTVPPTHFGGWDIIID
jgi:hypothetical protein